MILEYQDIGLFCMNILLLYLFIYGFQNNKPAIPSDTDRNSKPVIDPSHQNFNLIKTTNWTSYSHQKILNSTYLDQKSEPKIQIIYNRIPKCGSETMSWLIAKMFKNRHNHWHSKGFFVAGEKHDLDFQNETYRQNFLTEKLPRFGGNFVYVRLWGCSLIMNFYETRYNLR